MVNDLVGCINEVISQGVNLCVDQSDVCSPVMLLRVAGQRSDLSCSKQAHIVAHNLHGLHYMLLQVSGDILWVPEHSCIHAQCIIV